MIYVANTMSKIWGLTWIILGALVWVYSYGFVDLNLTLSSHPLVTHFVTTIQKLVYFNRPLSIQVFVGLISLLTLSYGASLRSAYKDGVATFPWKLVSVLSLIFALAYPMLSSDVFKYLFSAKMIVVYHANPYVVTPNFFENDTWIRFMRWVHTTTPYGPVFTLATIPYYLLGLGKFVPALYLFKLDQIAWYLLTIYLVGKLTETQGWKKTAVVFSQLFVALNPLIIMEWLVNAHNDASMIALCMLALYLAIKDRKAWSLISLAASVGIKYITVVLAPLLLFPSFIKKNFTRVVYGLTIALSVTPLLYHYSYQYQPWYVTWIIPLVALVPSKGVRLVAAIYSCSVMTRYLYFVSTGSWLGTQLEHAAMTFLPPLIVGAWFMCKGSARKS
jgi:hypothetical protein